MFSILKMNVFQFLLTSFVFFPPLYILLCIFVFLKVSTFITPITSFIKYSHTDSSAAGANSACGCCFQSSSTPLH